MSSEDFLELEPIYETLSGWRAPTQHVHLYNNLPLEAKKYIRRIEELLEIPISLISVGPERHQTIWMDKLFEEEIGS